ncbi:12076_t:CDS:1, partial [Cetraspora pellucida]
RKEVSEVELGDASSLTAGVLQYFPLRFPLPLIAYAYLQMINPNKMKSAFIVYRFH